MIWASMADFEIRNVTGITKELRRRRNEIATRQGSAEESSLLFSGGIGPLRLWTPESGDRERRGETSRGQVPGPKRLRIFTGTRTRL